MRKLLWLLVLILVVGVGCSDNQDTGEIDVLRSTVELQKDQITAIRELVSVINLSNEELKMVLQANQLKLDKVFSGQLEVNQTVETLVKENESMEKRFENLVDSVENLAKENDLIEKRFEALDGNGDNGDFDVLSEAVRNLSSQINDLKPELNKGIESLKDQFNQFVKDNGDLAPQVAKLDKRVQELAAQLNVLDKKGNGVGVDVAVQKQIQILKREEEPGSKVSAVQTLGRMREGAVDAVPALVQAFGLAYDKSQWDTVKRLRERIMGALNNIVVEGSVGAIPALKQALLHSHSGLRRTAASLLGKIGSADALPALILALQDPDVETRGVVVGALGGIGKAAVPELIKLLGDPKIRGDAARALGNIGTPEAIKAAVPALIQALQDQNREVRRDAVKVLGMIGPEAKDAVPALVQLLQDKNVRSAAAEALGNIGPEAKDAVPALIKLLQDKDHRFRVAVAEVLRKIGPEAKDAVPTLINLLRSNDSSVRRNAAETLGKIGEAAVPELIKLLGDPKIGGVAAEALGNIGPGAKAAVPALIQILQDGEKQGRYDVNVATALGSIGSVDAVPFIIQHMKIILQSKNWAGNTRFFADVVLMSEAFAQIGEGAVPILPSYCYLKR